MSDITIENLTITLGLDEEARRILDDVSFAVRSGESFGLVGESGSGKSTILKCIGLLFNAWTGSIAIGGKSVRDTARRAYCRNVQMVFQDPYGSLHPRHSIRTTLAEPLIIHGLDRRRERMEQAMVDVGLPPSFLDRYPHELSGGQRQRVAIARALILEPSVLLLDEPTSALDVSVQAEVLNLLSDIRAQRKLTYLLVSHDLAVIDHMCDQFAIMLQGRIVEVLDRAAIPGNDATDPYARELIGASLDYDRAA
jgi:ABC-type dipeptide/oligopeptide/nickel transport system ATPase subunit